MRSKQISGWAAKLLAFSGLLIWMTIVSGSVAEAASIRLVALGASNTNGKGVGSAEAWPAVLASLLRAKGYDVSLTVSAVNGETSDQILGRLEAAMGPGTQVVIYDLGRANDRRNGLSPGQVAADEAQIVSRIRAHGAQPIKVPYDGGGGFQKQPDGKHLTAASHAQVAAILLPKVIAAMRLSQH